MLTRQELTELSRAREADMVLSVYLARHNSDPGDRGAWRLRLDGALDTVRASVEQDAPEDLAAFDKAAALVNEGLRSYGRVLPHEGWSGFATGERLWHAEALPFAPTDLVRWRQGIYASPYVRALKSRRPVVLAVLTRMHATLYRYLNGELGEGLELHAEWPAAEGSDVGVSKRAATASGVRGVTRTDFAQRVVDENVRRLHGKLSEAIRSMAGSDGGIVLGGSGVAIGAVRNELGDSFAGRIVEAPELSFDSSREKLLAAVASAASELTVERQSRLLEACFDAGGRASRGWNETYRALAAGAVDTLLLSRRLIESSPEDAERLVRLGLSQGAEVEELGDELGDRLLKEAGGVAARLRFRVQT